MFLFEFFLSPNIFLCSSEQSILTSRDIILIDAFTQELNIQN